MNKSSNHSYKLLQILFISLLSIIMSIKSYANNSFWEGNINPILKDEWTIENASHLLERAGFGGTPEEIEYFFSIGPDKATDHLIYYDNIPTDNLKEFDE